MYSYGISTAWIPLRLQAFGMSRINTNVSSLTAQLNLARVNAQEDATLTRLSTGLRINSGKDDPAGLMASELLLSDITGVGKAVSNSQRANQVVATADSALGQISSLLNDLRGLVVESANKGAVSDEQIASNQLQADAALEAISRIAQTTSFQGRRLLDGSLALNTTYVAGGEYVRDLQIDSAALSPTGSMTVSIDVDSAAAQATASMVFAGDRTAKSAVIEVAGASGMRRFQFMAGTPGEDVAAAINLMQDATGVHASWTAAMNTFTLTALEYGSLSTVSLKIIRQSAGGDFVNAQAHGADVAATVNGFRALGRGNTLSINTQVLALAATLRDGAAGPVTFTIDGGGALFQLGPDVVSNQQARIGIEAVDSTTLGGSSGRLYELASGQAAALARNPQTAAAIVDEAIGQVSGLRGRLGAFQKTTLAANSAALQDTLQSLTAAESSIRDADFAAETASLTRSQILRQSGMQVLSIANRSPEAVLSLLK